MKVLLLPLGRGCWFTIQGKRGKAVVSTHRSLLLRLALVPAGRRPLSPSQGYLRLRGGESKSCRFPRHVAPAPPCFGGPGPWRSLWELEELPKKMFCEPRGALGAPPTRLREHSRRLWAGGTL